MGTLHLYGRRSQATGGHTDVMTSGRHLARTPRETITDPEKRVRNVSFTLFYRRHPQKKLRPLHLDRPADVWTFPVL